MKVCTGSPTWKFKTDLFTPSRAHQKSHHSSTPGGIFCLVALDFGLPWELRIYKKARTLDYAAWT